MKGLLRTFAAVLLAGVLSGCISTSVVMTESGKTYPPAARTQLLFKLPDRAYKQIAILESRGAVGTPLPDLLENMRQKGQEIGADAVLPVQDASQENPQGLIYNPLLRGYQTLPGGRVPIIRGIAIKYE